MLLHVEPARARPLNHEGTNNRSNASLSTTSLPSSHRRGSRASMLTPSGQGLRTRRSTIPDQPAGAKTCSRRHAFWRWTTLLQLTSFPRPAKHSRARLSKCFQLLAARSVTITSFESQPAGPHSPRIPACTPPPLQDSTHALSADTTTTTLLGQLLGAKVTSSR